MFPMELDSWMLDLCSYGCCLFAMELSSFSLWIYVLDARLMKLCLLIRYGIVFFFSLWIYVC